jgi:hypothetical protein
MPRIPQQPNGCAAAGWAGWLVHFLAIDFPASFSIFFSSTFLAKMWLAASEFHSQPMGGAGD